MKTLYTDIESCITNNGKSSIFFKLERGIRQGCCLSALLFIIVAELLAISIRTNKLIHGVKIQQDEFKICRLADDTTLFLRDTCSLKIVLNLLCPPHWGVDILFLLFPPSAVRRPTWFPDILGNSSYPIFTKFGMQVYWVNSLYGIAFGDDISIAN